MEVALVLVSAVCVKLEEVRPCLRASSVSVDLLRCHFDKERSGQFDCHKPSPGVVLSQLSPFYAQEIQHHQQKIFPSGRNGSVGVDALLQSRQRHPGGGLLRARRQFNASRSMSPSDCCFTVSSRSVSLLF